MWHWRSPVRNRSLAPLLPAWGVIRRFVPRGIHAAGVAELVDALDLGSSGENRGGSSPSARTRFTSVTGGHSRRLPTRLPDGPVAKEGCGIGEPSLAEEKGSMKISETRAEGLIREYAIVISAAEIDEQLSLIHI